MRLMSTNNTNMSSTAALVIVTALLLWATPSTACHMMRQKAAAAAVNDNTKPTIYDCLQAASGGDECRAAFDGQCVWCAEPIYGLCVTPGIAAKIGMLPFFTCDEQQSQSQADAATQMDKEDAEMVVGMRDEEDPDDMNTMMMMPELKEDEETARTLRGSGGKV